MLPNWQFPTDLARFTEKILNAKVTGSVPVKDAQSNNGIKVSNQHLELFEVLGTL